MNPSPKLPKFAKFHRTDIRSRSSTREPKWSLVRELICRAGSEGNALGNCLIAVGAMEGLNLDTII